EFPHAISAQGRRSADGSAFSQLEAGDRLPRPVDPRLLAGDEGQLVGSFLDHFPVLVGRAESHIDDDLVQGGNLHDVGETQLLEQPGSDLVDVFLLEARSAHRSPPHFLQTRCFWPLSSTRIPIRVAPQSSHRIITLEMSIGLTRSMLPPCMVWPRAFSWRLAVFTPSTISLC